MKHMPVLLIAALLTCLLSCSEDKPTSPGGPDYDLVASETIGPAGGMLEDEDFTLTVPPGAFGEEAQLKLYASADDQPFEAYQITGSYRLEGVPAHYALPLEMRVRYRGTLSNPAHLAAGTEGTAYGSGESIFSYQFYPAADSAGYLVARLPVPEAGRSLRRAGSLARGHGAGFQGYLLIMVLGLRDYFYHFTSGGHFMIWYPIDRALLIDDLAGYLEAAYDTCAAMGFRPDEAKRWPQEVHILPHGLKSAAEYAEFVPILPDEGVCLEAFYLNNDNFDDWHLDEIRMSAGREVVDLMLFTYDPVYPRASPHVIPNQEWLDCAVERWSEAKFTDTPGHVPADFRSHEMEPFAGMEIQEDMSGEQEHGQGMSALIEYLTAPDRFGDRVLAPIYQRISNSEIPGRAIVEHIDEYPNVWWPEFFRRYVGGQIYGVRSGVFTAYDHTAGDFQTSQDTARTFHGTYRDLSAKLYMVELDNQNLPEAAELVFRAGSDDVDDDDLQVIVFTVKDDALEFFEQGLEVTVGNVKGLTQDGYDLLAVVVNSSFEEWLFEDQSEIDLEIRLKEADFNYCWIYGAVTGHWQNSQGESYESWYSNEWTARGSFQNNTFTGSPIPEIDGDLCTGFVEVVVDPITRQVTSFTAEYFTPSFMNDMWWTRNIAGGNVPYHGDLEWAGLMGDEYVCEGSGTSGCISAFEYMWEQDDGWWQGFEAFHCEEDSRLEIRLYAVP
jgi:hypothetical protein